MLGTHNLNEYEFDEIDPWELILLDVAYTIHTTNRTITTVSPGQLVFGRDMLFSIPYTPTCGNITGQKQKGNNYKYKSRKQATCGS